MKLKDYIICILLVICIGISQFCSCNINENEIDKGASVTSTGVNGKDGADGKDGKDGIDGRGIVSSAIIDKHLILYYTDGTFDDAGVVSGEDGADGVDGKDGINGVDGKDGLNGVNGTNGANGKDGTDGKDGVGVKNAYLTVNKCLIIELTDGTQINAGFVTSSATTSTVVESTWKYSLFFGYLLMKDGKEMVQTGTKYIVSEGTLVDPYVIEQKMTPNSSFTEYCSNPVFRGWYLDRQGTIPYTSGVTVPAGGIQIWGIWDG